MKNSRVDLDVPANLTGQPCETKPSPKCDTPRDDHLPFPPRFWWLKRILATTACLLIALVILRCCWGWYANWKLNARIAEYRALGQPVLLEDFRFPPIPDDQNAAYFLKLAADGIAVPPDVQIDPNDVCNDLNLVRANQEDVRRFLETNCDVFELIDRAMPCDAVDWNWELSSPMEHLRYPELISASALGRFLSTAALYEHALGDDAEAIHRLQRLRFLASSIMGRYGNLVHHDVFISIERKAIYCIEQIAPDLSIARDPNDSRSASPEDVRALYKQLLDDEYALRNLERAFQGERLMCLDLYFLESNNPTEPGDAGRINSWHAHPWMRLGNAKDLITIIDNYPCFYGWRGLFANPIFTQDALHMVECYTESMPTLRRSCFCPAMDIMPNPFESHNVIQHMIFPFTDLFDLPFRCAIENHFRILAHRRMAAVALALRLFEVETGRRPATLTELIPEYLIEVPGDPYSPEGRPLQYVPNARHPILYSVNENQTDDGGRFELTSTGYIREYKLDLVFFLDGQRPLHVTTTDVPPPEPSVSDTAENGSTAGDTIK